MTGVRKGEEEKMGGRVDQHSFLMFEYAYTPMYPASRVLGRDCTASTPAR